MTALTLPSAEGGLRRYLDEIRKFPLLAQDEEFVLAKRWKEHQDPVAAHRLVTSHLRLSAKIAIGYRGYGLPIGEMISEGNLGLMHAVRKFDPDKGFRLATYAIWWIRAAVQEYILRSWSLVRLGASAAQKRLFFNLRKLKARISALSDGDLAPDQARDIAQKLGVSEADVVDMDRRLSGRDASLNVAAWPNSEAEWLDALPDETSVDPELEVVESEQRALKMQLLSEAMETLDPRERHIFTERRLKDPAVLLDTLAAEYGVSRERVRQLEVRAFEKVQAHVRRGMDLREHSGLEEKTREGMRVGTPPRRRPRQAGHKASQFRLTNGPD